MWRYLHGTLTKLQVRYYSAAAKKQDAVKSIHFQRFYAVFSGHFSMWINSGSGHGDSKDNARQQTKKANFPTSFQQKTKA
jgi:hypothetical protein